MHSLSLGFIEKNKGAPFPRSTFIAEYPIESTDLTNGRIHPFGRSTLISLVRTRQILAGLDSEVGHD